MKFFQKNWHSGVDHPPKGKKPCFAILKACFFLLNIHPYNPKFLPSASGLAVWHLIIYPANTNSDQPLKLKFNLNPERERSGLSSVCRFWCSSRAMSGYIMRLDLYVILNLYINPRRTQNWKGLSFGRTSFRWSIQGHLGCVFSGKQNFSILKSSIFLLEIS